MPADQIEKTTVFERNFDCQIMDKKNAIRSESVPNQNTVKVYRKKNTLFFVAKKNTKITQNCTMINSNGRLGRDQWSSSQAATQANILITFKILQ